jgi:chromosome segregation ATPase
MRQGMKQNKKTTAEDNGGLYLATTTAIASILGNVAQAIENSKVEKVAQSLRADRTRLMQALRRWQQSYQTEQAKLVATQAGLEKECQEKAELQGKVKALDTRITELSTERDRANATCAAKDIELSGLRERVARLERESKKGKRHG